MTGKERVIKAIKCEEVDRVPWIPFVGCHGGYLLKKTATEYLKSADNIIAGLNKAVELYKPDGIPVVFDLQIEAEILGCNLVWADDNPPAVTSHPLKEGKELKDLSKSRVSFSKTSSGTGAGGSHVSSQSIEMGCINQTSYSITQDTVPHCRGN